MVGQGKTEDEIKDYFVGKYGPVILLEPSTEGISIYASTALVMFTLSSILIELFKSDSDKD